MKLPTYGNNKVRQAPLPGAYQTANHTAASHGGGQARQLEALGGTAAGLGGQMLTRAIRDQQELNFTKVQEALNEMNTTYDSEMISIQERLGGDAEGVGVYAQEFTQKVVQDRLPQFDNDAQRQMFERQAWGASHNFNARAEVHGRKQQRIRAESSMRSGIANANNAGIAMVTDTTYGGFGDLFAAINSKENEAVGLSSALSASRGEPRPTTTDANNTARSVYRRGIVNAFKQSGNHAGAVEYIKRTGDESLNGLLPDLTKSIQKAKQNDAVRQTSTLIEEALLAGDVDKAEALRRGMSDPSDGERAFNMAKSAVDRHKDAEREASNAEVEEYWVWKNERGDDATIEGAIAFLDSKSHIPAKEKHDLIEKMEEELSEGSLTQTQKDAKAWKQQENYDKLSDSFRRDPDKGRKFKSSEWEGLISLSHLKLIQEQLNDIQFPEEKANASPTPNSQIKAADSFFATNYKLAIPKGVDTDTFFPDDLIGDELNAYNMRERRLLRAKYGKKLLELEPDPAKWTSNHYEDALFQASRTVKFVEPGIIYNSTHEVLAYREGEKRKELGLSEAVGGGGQQEIDSPKYSAILSRIKSDGRKPFKIDKIDGGGVRIQAKDLRTGRTVYYSSKAGN